MKKFLLILICFILCCGCATTTAEPPEEQFYTYGMLKQEIKKQQAYMDAAHQMAEGARGLGYDESHRIIRLAKEEWASAREEKLKYEEIYNELWKQKEIEYPEATYIWTYFKDLGFNDYVCAGILGNVMVEVGGQTLALQSTIYSYDGTYYGICQWSPSYADVRGADLPAQCDFLRDTLEYEFNVFGFCYADNFNYEDFLKLENAEEAALAFAKCYERCASFSYDVRQTSALKAYNYFVE